MIPRLKQTEDAGFDVVELYASRSSGRVLRQFEMQCIQEFPTLAHNEHKVISLARYKPRILD